MKSKSILSYLIFLLLLVLLAFPLPALADGIIIPDPPICDPGPCPPHPLPIDQLAIRYHHVDVTIKDQVAVTHVDQVFYNPNDWQIEGMYLFPIPLDAAVSSFTLWMDGQPVEGKVLNAQEARQTYEQIVRSMRDPALLEYAGRGAVQARIFPIPARGERRIELEYTQALAADNGLVNYIYPLNTEKFSVLPLESVSISVEVESQTPIRAVYSPTHEIAIDQEDDHHFTAGYEAADITPDTDFALYFSLGETEAFHLISYRDPGDTSDQDGFFLLMLAPRPDAAGRTVPKDVILVLDRSGSMDGEKFLQAQEALRYILRNLNEEDRFNIIAFSTGLETYASRLRTADEASEAVAWVDRLSAQGSTDINRALLEASSLADEERPTYLIFLTDGLPTEGEIDSQKILDNLVQTAPESLRLFAFGVGYDVDTFLLDSLAQAHHGLSTYVMPGEKLDEVISGFYAKISTPVLTDLSLDFDELAIYDLYPSPLPDLFVGTQVILVGRYRLGGTTNVTLTGDIDGRTETFRFPEQIFSTDTRSNDMPLASLPRIWATRKIGYLLNQIRLHGPNEETIEQIVNISIRYGIVTPYTSYLVTEDVPLGVEEREQIIEQEYNDMLSAPTMPAFGEAAVGKAVEQGQLAGADSAAPPPEEASNDLRIVGSRTFIKDGETWIDTSFDPKTMPTIKVPFLSEDYFRLAEARPALATAFALGEKVIALADGIAYEVVEAGEPAGPVDIPPAITPSVPGPFDTDENSSESQGTPTVVPVAQSAEVKQRPCPAGLIPLAFVMVGWIGAGMRKNKR